MSIATPTAPAQKVTVVDDEFMIIDETMIVFADRAAHVVTITVPVAQMLLARNPQNRPLDKANLTKLLTDVTNGDFSYNGASIVLSADGCLLDGQHRLWVIVESGISLVSVIATGVPTAAQREMDSGKMRTLANNLEMGGEQHPTALAAVLVGLQAWDRGERATQVSARGTTVNTSYRFLEEHPECREITEESLRLAPKIPGFGAKAIAQFIWAFDKLNVNDRKDFFDKLHRGAGLPEGDPILQLRNFLIREKSSTAKVTAHHRAALLCKAWNLYRDGGKKKQKLTFRAGGANPEAFPEPQ